MHYRGRYCILASLTPTQLPPLPPLPPLTYPPSLQTSGAAPPPPQLYIMQISPGACDPHVVRETGTGKRQTHLLLGSSSHLSPGRVTCGDTNFWAWDWGSLDLNQSLSPAPGWSRSGRFSPDPIRGGVVPVLLQMGVMPLDPLVAQHLTQGSSQGLVCPGPQEPGGASGVGGARERLQGQAGPAFRIHLPSLTKDTIHLI